MGVEAPSYRGFRFPVEVISHCVWLYHRFPLSFREVEEMMLERGIVVSHETIRQWCAKFGQAYANALLRRRPRPGDKWHLDEVYIKIVGKTHYLWRAVDQHGNVLDILVTSGVTPRLPSGSSASCSQRWSTCPGCWSLTNWAATRRRDAGCCARSSTANRST